MARVRGNPQVTHPTDERDGMMEAQCCKVADTVWCSCDCGTLFVSHVKLSMFSRVPCSPCPSCRSRDDVHAFYGVGRSESCLVIATRKGSIRTPPADAYWGTNVMPPFLWQEDRNETTDEREKR